MLVGRLAVWFAFHHMILKAMGIHHNITVKTTLMQRRFIYLVPSRRVSVPIPKPSCANNAALVPGHNNFGACQLLCLNVSSWYYHSTMKWECQINPNSSNHDGFPCGQCPSGSTRQPSVAFATPFSIQFFMVLMDGVFFFGLITGNKNRLSFGSGIIVVLFML